MLKLIIIIALAITCSTGLAQNRKSMYDPNPVTRFNKLNNTSFATLQLEDTSGNLFNTASLSGKTIYVDFWFTTCPPCIAEIPYSQSLQSFFSLDTNIVFLNICIENIDRKTAWKEMIKAKQIKGVHLFYARNRPQKVNLLREYAITFPTYLLINEQMKIVGYDAPRPSEKGFVHWAINQVEAGSNLSTAYTEMVKGTKKYVEFMNNNFSKIFLDNKNRNRFLYRIRC